MFFVVSFQFIAVLERVAENHVGFDKFERYQVRMTLYGSSRSFDPDTATIVLFTTNEGSFKGGGGVHTIVHEMMHLAVETGLVQRFGLSHWEKERLVDLLVQREFANVLAAASAVSMCLSASLRRQQCDSRDRARRAATVNGCARAIGPSRGRFAKARLARRRH